MKAGKATARLFLQGLSASLMAVGLLFLASPLLALTWGEINQNLERCSTLTKKATTLIKEVKITNIRDDQSRKQEVAQIKKAEYILGQVIDIYQNLAHFDIPTADVNPVILKAYKSAIPSNLAKAKGCLRQAQQLQRTWLKPHPINAAGIQVTLVIDLKDLDYQTTFLQKRLQANKLQ
jgi:hypothetical protein